MSSSRNALADERPLTARSVVLSTLLGTDPPWLSTRRLVRALELFGIADSTARAALSRMTARGELVARRNGYALAGPLLDRQRRQVQARHPLVGPWDGSWWLGAVTAERRPAHERLAFRRAMDHARFAELREGLWTRPDNLSSPLDHRLRWWRASPRDDARALAASLWDLGAWAERAGELRSRMTALGPALRAGSTDALAPGFVVSAAVLRLVQHDPLLPTELLPRRWPGRVLRTDYDRFDGAYRAVLRRWLTAEA